MSSGLRGYSTLFARLALAAGFLSAVADRFGVWGPPGAAGVAWGDFASFTAYAATINPWSPPALVPALAWIATLAEIALAILLDRDLPLLRLATLPVTAAASLSRFG